MIPVMQTCYGPVDGNCFEACLASVLECELGEIPRQPDGLGTDLTSWFQELTEWLGWRGLGYVQVQMRHDQIAVYPTGDWIAMLDVPGHAFGHAVVCRGDKVIHDPDQRFGPGRADLQRLEGMFVVTALNPGPLKRWLEDRVEVA